MIKEALEYIVGLNEPHYREVDGMLYADRELSRIPTCVPGPKALEFNTLTGLLEYVCTADELDAAKLFIRVVSPTGVSVCGALNDDNDRYVYARAEAMLPGQKFGQWMEQESFNIYLRTHFVPTDAVKKMLAFTGTVIGDDVQVLTDDGVSQQVTVKTMVSGNQPAIAPNECVLKPYRTFLEVSQPESPFVFRCSRSSDEIRFALFEADGGMWKYEAMESLRRYICEVITANAEEQRKGQISVLC